MNDSEKSLKGSEGFEKDNVGNGFKLFESKYFSDERILCQLCDDHYQTKLSDHNWPLLERMGPCFYRLAE